MVVPREHTRPMKSVAPIALTIALAIALVAGCGSAAGSASASASLAPSVAPSVAVSPAATASSSGPAPSASVVALPHDDAALEGRLPSAVNGSPLVVFSVGPITVAGNPGADPVKDLAKALGDGSGNFGLAFANDPTSPTFNFFALRVPGAETDALLTRYGELTVADTAGATSESVALGGKQVMHVTSPGNPIGDVWIYAIDDTVFGVQAGSADQASELLALLP
jgi:hypothetical protein